jgi:hypothetical protein
MSLEAKETISQYRDRSQFGCKRPRPAKVAGTVNYPTRLAVCHGVVKRGPQPGGNELY